MSQGTRVSATGVFITPAPSGPHRGPLGVEHVALYIGFTAVCRKRYAAFGPQRFDMISVMSKDKIITPTKIETGFEGVSLYPGWFDVGAQRALLEALRPALKAAPSYRPLMPRTGKPWSILQTNMGPLGWLSGKDGYLYGRLNPETGEPWPAIPAALLQLWSDLSGFAAPPECCLVNFYQGAKARMGLHQDRDEEALDAPVLSVSLGDTCVFRVGGFARSDTSKSFRLASGDVLVLGGPSRPRFHGVDRIIPQSSRILEESGLGGGRLNLTLRRVTNPNP